MKQKFFLAFSIGVILLAFFVNAQGIETDHIILKNSIKEGSSFNKTIVIENTNSRGVQIEVQTPEFALVNQNDFFLDIGEKRELLFSFDVENKTAGVYISEIKINEIVIPTILEIETDEVLFDTILNAPVAYSKVSPGEEFVIENDIFNLENIGSKNIRVDYYMKDFSGKIFYSESENVVIDREFLTTKTVAIPEDIEEGDYIFISVVSFDGTVGTGTYLFKIQKQGLPISFNNFSMWAIFILLILIILFILYNQKQRDRYIIEITKQYQEELHKERSFIEKEKQELEKLPSLKEEKIKYLKTREKAIKVIYKTRIKTIRRLRKENKNDEIKKKIKQWKKEGYQINDMFKKNPNIKKLKKQGYKF